MRLPGLEQFNSSKIRYSTLRMTPMIDVIFLLLIFFFVAGKYRPQENFLPFQLPAAQGQVTEIGKPEPLKIYIAATDDGCQIRVGEEDAIQLRNQTVESDLALLMEKIKDRMLAQKRATTDPVEIMCEGQVKWEYTAQIYNVLFGAGLTDITFSMTEQPENGQFK